MNAVPPRARTWRAHGARPQHLARAVARSSPRVGGLRSFAAGGVSDPLVDVGGLLDQLCRDLRIRCRFSVLQQRGCCFPSELPKHDELSHPKPPVRQEIPERVRSFRAATEVIAGSFRVGSRDDRPPWGEHPRLLDGAGDSRFNREAGEGASVWGPARRNYACCVRMSQLTIRTGCRGQSDGSRCCPN